MAPSEKDFRFLNDLTSANQNLIGLIMMANQRGIALTPDQLKEWLPKIRKVWSSDGQGAGMIHAMEQAIEAAEDLDEILFNDKA